MARTERFYKTTRACPKCNSKHLVLVNVLEAVEFYDLTPEGVGSEFSEAVGIPEGLNRVEGQCKACGHMWKMRGLPNGAHEAFEKTPVATFDAHPAEPLPRSFASAAAYRNRKD